LIINGCLTFVLFRDEALVATISIGHIRDEKIKSLPGNYPVLQDLGKATRQEDQPQNPPIAPLHFYLKKNTIYLVY